MALCAVSAVCALSSCSDFLTIYPTDKIVGDDFWKTKADVDQMVDGCDLSMLSYDIQERAIMWGAYRSDELVKRKDLNSTTLDNVSAAHLLPTMGYCSWAAFYKVINNCNIVLNHAPEVMEEDPEFTQGDYQVVRAQMLALRSLCYFYLVRAFRDVPYVSTSYEDDSQIEPIAQSAPAVVLQNCLNDLEESRNYIMKTGGYGRNDWRNWGYFTLDAVNALMADIYLWRAAMTHNNADYQQVVDCANRIIDSKDAYYKKFHTEVVGSGATDKYHLEDGDMVHLTVFYYNDGNQHESILEWQFNGRNNANTALENLYYKSDKNATFGTLKASPVFNSIAATANTMDGKKLFFSKNDYRFWNNVYDAGNEDAEEMPIRKMVNAEAEMTIVTPKSAAGISKSNNRDYDNFRQNWIVYRLTDVMLMKAEALVAMASGDTDQTPLKEAFDLVQVVNKRSMDKEAKDTLIYDNFNTKDQMELLVLAERGRELCFEGKRWWDLMRFCYRGMNGVDINQTIGQGAPQVALRSDMLKLVLRKYSGGEGDAVQGKMVSEPYLYWPLQESETKVNNLLIQNPVWAQEQTTSKQ